jgi:DNA-directed RNA polymerase specialized sigma24 family protein
VVQEAFLALYRGWDRVDDPGDALGYLRAAVLNGARSVHRSRRRSRARLLRSVQHTPPVWAAESAVMERGPACRAGRGGQAAAAPARSARARYYLDLSEQEIAGILGVARGTVSSTATLALSMLARQFEEER